MHTFYSVDGVYSPRQMVLQAKKIGLDGIAITDHCTVRGWAEAEKAGAENGILIICGEEIKAFDGPQRCEILGLFLNELVEPGPVAEVIDQIRIQGGLAIAAHPFSRHRDHFQNLNRYVKKIDGVEVVNAYSLHKSTNELALEFAKKYKLAQIGGSDAHIKQCVGEAYTSAKADSLYEFKKAILKNKCSAAGRRYPLRKLARQYIHSGFYKHVIKSRR